MSKLHAPCLVLVAFLLLGDAQGQFPNTVDINGSLPAGSVTKNGPGSFTAVGGGADIWDVSDQFFYAYSEANGDFDIKVRGAWRDLRGPITATASTATITDTGARGTQRFYRILQTD